MHWNQMNVGRDSEIPTCDHCNHGQSEHNVNLAGCVKIRHNGNKVSFQLEKESSKLFPFTWHAVVLTMSISKSKERWWFSALQTLDKVRFLQLEWRSSRGQRLIQLLFQYLQQYPSPPPHLCQSSHAQPSKDDFMWSFYFFMFSGFSLLLECSFSFPATSPHFDQLSWFTLSLMSHEFSLEYSNTAVPNQCCEILLVKEGCFQWASGFYISHWMFPDQRNITAFWVFLPQPELDHLKCRSWFLHVLGHSPAHIL